MTRSDWLVGGDRRTAAAERIYAAATDLIIARDGLEALRRRQLGRTGALLPRDDLPPCRRKGRDPRRRTDPRRGPDRRYGAAGRRRSQRVRPDRHRDHGGAQGDSIRSARSADDHLDSRFRRWTWLTDSPIVARFATDLNGLTDDDPQAGAVDRPYRAVTGVLARSTIAEVERQMVQRFVSPAFPS